MKIEKENIEGAQRIGGLWRVYLKDETARVKLLCQGITLRGQQVELKREKPLPYWYVILRTYETTRLFIINVPSVLSTTQR